MDKQYCDKCQMEVDNLEQHKVDVHGDDAGAEMPDDDNNMT